MTLDSSASLLCPVDEFLKRVDRGAIAKLASDDPNGIPVPDANLGTDGNIIAALKDASGLVESAAMNAARYKRVDLELIVATDCNSQGILFRIVSDLAWTFLFERRPNVNIAPPASLGRSMEWLEMLAQGKRIFAFTETQNATTLERTESDTADILARNGVVTQASAYFGRRADVSQGWSGG
jgi:hypothetical protein